MKSTIIALYILLSSKLIYCSDANRINVDYYFDKESFNEKHNIFTFGLCLKSISDESGKTCMISKTERFEGDIPVKSCPLLLEARESLNNAVIGSHLRILPIDRNRLIVMSLEKNWINSTALEIFLKLTMVQFEDCKIISELIIPMSLEKNDILDDYFLNDIHFLYGDSDSVLAIDNKHQFPSKINKMIFDRKGKYKIEPWLELHNGTLKEIVLLKQEFDDTTYLVIDNFLNAYVVKASGSEIKKLDFDHDKQSQLLYSTSHSYVSLCYETMSSFSCAVFGDNAELISTWKFNVDWKVKNGLVHYNPNFGFTLITDTYSESCAETELKQFLTTIIDNEIKSKDLGCIQKDFRMIGTFRRTDKQECFFIVKLNTVGTQLVVETKNTCFMSFIEKMMEEFSKFMKNNEPVKENSLKDEL